MTEEIPIAELCDEFPVAGLVGVRRHGRWRRHTAAWGVSLAVHALAAVGLGSLATLEVVQFGGWSRVGNAGAIQAAWAEEGSANDDRLATTDPAPTVITPLEAWHDDRHFVANRVAVATPVSEPPTIDLHGDMPVHLTAVEDRPTREADINEVATPTTRATNESGGARRRTSVSPEPSVISVDAPHPDFRFAGSPCRYPDVAVASGWYGTVMLRILFNDDGAITDVGVEKSSGHSVLDAEAARAAKGWRVVPARTGGRVRGMTVLKPIVFSLDAR